MKPKAKRISAKKLCSKVIRVPGLKVDGTLKKGHRYLRGGGIVKSKRTK